MFGKAEDPLLKDVGQQGCDAVGDARAQLLPDDGVVVGLSDA
ncbi:hypothetical protein AB0L53_57875 [Nonomuraea sp. NPDC052129]